MVGGRKAHRASAVHLEGSRRGGSHLGGRYSTATATYQSHGRPHDRPRNRDEGGSEGGLTDIGVVGQRIRVPGREILWMFAVFQEVLPERGIRAPRLQKRMGPAGGVGRLAQQEGLQCLISQSTTQFMIRVRRPSNRRTCTLICRGCRARRP